MRNNHKGSRLAGVGGGEPDNDSLRAKQHSKVRWRLQSEKVPLYYLIGREHCGFRIADFGLGIGSICVAAQLGALVLRR